MAVERFQPVSEQQQRLSEEEYVEIASVTLNDLAAIDVPNTDGLSEEEIQALIDAEQQRLEAFGQGQGQAVLDGQTTIEQFERDMAEAIAASMLLMLLLSAGGFDELAGNPEGRNYVRGYNSVIEGELRALRHTADRLSGGELTPDELLDRSRRRSRAVYPSSNQSGLFSAITRATHNEALRFLDPTATHCRDCPAYDTQGQWIPIENVIPVGVACICGGRCRCTVVTRFNPAQLLQQIQGGTLGQQVSRSIANQNRVLADFRRRYGFD